MPLRLPLFHAVGPAWRSVCAVVAGCATALLLSACATPDAGSASREAARNTSSASPEVQRAARTRLDLATSYLEINRLDVALEEVSYALALDPGMTDAYLVRGLVLAQRQDFAAAKADYERVLRVRPDDAYVIHNMGFLLCQQKQYDEAQDWFHRALAIPGYSSRARTLMAQGLCFQAAGKSHQAIDSLTQAHALENNNPVVAYNLAALLYGRGEVANAQVYLRNLNASNLANAETLWLGIKVENAMGNAIGVRELGNLLGQKFPLSREYSLYERKAFYE